MPSSGVDRGTKGQLQAAAEALVEQARRDCRDKVEAEAGSRDALARGLRLEAEERQRLTKKDAPLWPDDLVTASRTKRRWRATRPRRRLAACEARSKKRRRLGEALKAEAAQGLSRRMTGRRFTSSAALDAVVHRIADNEAAARNAHGPRGRARGPPRARRATRPAAALAVERDDRERHLRTRNARFCESPAAAGENEVHDRRSGSRSRSSVSGWTRT